MCGQLLDKRPLGTCEKHVLNKKYALNNEICLTTSVYGKSATCTMFRGKSFTILLTQYQDEASINKTTCSTSFFDDAVQR